MSYDKSRHVQACVAFMLCASMIFGMFLFDTGHALAAPDNAAFRGNVKVGGTPAPDTLILYSVDVDGSPAGNSTVSDVNGDYMIWMDGGHTYYVYFANGGAMFDMNAQLQSTLSVGQTKWLNATLNSAPERTVTLKGYLTNASNASQPVTTGHVLGFRMIMDSGPDYINWTVPDAAGYYEVMVLPGLVTTAVFDAPGYFPTMGMSSTTMASPGDSIWVNMSMIPFTGYTVNITGTVTESFGSTPIAGALVTASLEGVGFSTSNLTDALGHYKLQIIDGWGRIQVSAGGYVSQRQEIGFAGNMTLNYSLNQQDAKIYGWVKDAYTGEPIPNATVWANSGLFMTEQFNETLSGPDGSYNLTLCAGTWNIGARALGYGERGGSLALFTSDLLIQNITLTPESGMIKGFVMDGVNGLPIEGVTVVISGGSYRPNTTWTDSTGYYAINCLPDEYEMTFMAAGYMWERTMSAGVFVNANETVWHNHSLDPATVRLHGTVTDAITGARLTGVSVTAAGYSRSDPNFMRVATTSTFGGDYSMMVASDTTFTVVMADFWPDYESNELMTSVPDVPEFEVNISLLPRMGVPTYTLQGNVTDASDGNPIPWANVDATFGMSNRWSTSADGAGYYTLTVPTVNLTVGAQSSGYLRSEVYLPPGPVGGNVTQDFALDSHLEPPVFLNETVVPDSSLSVYNHANISFEVVEQYLGMIQMNLARVTNITGDAIWVQVIEGYNEMVVFGTFFGELDWQALGPDHTLFWLSDWDTTSDDLALLTDGTGAWEMSSSYGRTVEGYWTIWGEYSNASLMMFSLWGNAFFDAEGNYLGFDNGGGIIPGTDTDPTGTFWMGADYLQFNLTTGSIMGSVSRDTQHLEAYTMHFANPATYPSGDYSALIVAMDTSDNMNFTLVQFSVDNDAPVADPGDNQTQIVDLQVTLDATLSTDNIGIVNYTWSIEDGTAHKMYGAVVDYNFSTVGNHSVTVTVSDAAGYSTSASTWIEVLADLAPVAVAGPDQVVNEDTPVFFDGTGSHDDIGVTNYTWTIVGTSVVMYGPTPNHTFAAPGMHHVRLVVTDTIGQVSVYDEVVIAASDTTAPVADAGPDLMINVGTAASFDGSGSSDNAGVTQYTWTFTDGVPKTITGQSPTYTFNAGGEYTVTLTVRDAEGNSDTDTMVVQVNVAPDADAGTDMTAKQGDEVTFDGSSSTDDFEIQNYTWTFTYQGLSETLYGAAPKFTFEEPGTYTVQLTVRDAGGLTKTDSVSVTVTGKSSGMSFVNDYWWVLVIVAVIVVAAVVVLMRKGKGPAANKPDQGGSEVPPPPDESDELVFPPPDDKEL